MILLLAALAVLSLFALLVNILGWAEAKRAHSPKAPSVAGMVMAVVFPATAVAYIGVKVGFPPDMFGATHLVADMAMALASVALVVSVAHAELRGADPAFNPPLR